MRGSVEPVAVARDVASSSPSKPPSALDMMRYQRISPDCMPLANGGGSGGSWKPQPAAPRSSKDDDATAVATNSSRLASYLAATSLDPKPRARAPQPPPPLAPAPPSSSVTRSPARDHGHHYPVDLPDPTSPSSPGVGASGSAGPDATKPLQCWQKKRSRGRRDASGASASASASASTPSPQRRQAPVKIQRRSSAPAEKLMPPPSFPRGSTLRISSSLPARGGAATATDAHHGRVGAHPHHHRSAEERAGGQQSPAAAGAAKQRPAADKAAPHKAEAMVTGAQESKHHHQQGAGPSSSSKAAAAGQKHELPRIYTTLSRKEKEEDFLAMKGSKLPQRPKKRAKLVEKAVNFVCPGTWLADVTRSRYEVREKKCTKKQKRRGLKGMEMDSDSD